MIERVVVTGSRGGIGSACVRAFEALGAEVIGVDIREAPGPDTHLQLDLARPDSGEAVVEFLEDRPVDVLVNNAAVGFAQLAVETTAEDFDRVIAVNLRTPFLVSAALYPTLRQRQGVVVNVGSVHARATAARASVYAASKGGLDAMTRALAMEWAPDVRVNCVLPGAVETQMLTDGLGRAEQGLEDFARSHPLQRVGQPDEIAEAVVFLATNRNTTGATLVVDGGVTAHLGTE